MENVMYAVKRKTVSELTAKDFCIRGAQDFLDMVANISARTFILQKDQLTEEFYDLSTGIAGEILQKCSNYSIQLGIVGDFSDIAGRSLRDFIYESNRTGLVVFAPDKAEALRLLGF